MMRNPTTVYQVETAVEEICHDPDIILASGGGPLTKAERSKLGMEKLEELTIELIVYFIYSYCFAFIYRVCPCIFSHKMQKYTNCHFIHLFCIHFPLHLPS